MQKSFSTEKYYYYYYKPKPWKLFWINFQEMNVRKWMRFTLSLFSGSEIYYMIDHNNTVLGYCLLEKKGWRYPFLNDNDRIISPYVINPDYRGKGFGTQLLKDVVKNVGDKNRMYAMVRLENIASIRAMEKAGFTKYGYADLHSVFRQYRLKHSQADFLVFVNSK